MISKAALEDGRRRGAAFESKSQNSVCHNYCRQQFAIDWEISKLEMSTSSAMTNSSVSGGCICGLGKLTVCSLSTGEHQQAPSVADTETSDLTSHGDEISKEEKELVKRRTRGLLFPLVKFYVSKDVEYGGAISKLYFQRCLGLGMELPEEQKKDDWKRHKAVVCSSISNKRSTVAYAMKKNFFGTYLHPRVRSHELFSKSCIGRN